jgi:hypothetical protein
MWSTRSRNGLYRQFMADQKKCSWSAIKWQWLDAVKISTSCDCELTRLWIACGRSTKYPDLAWGIRLLTVSSADEKVWSDAFNSENSVMTGPGRFGYRSLARHFSVVVLEGVPSDTTGTQQGSTIHHLGGRVVRSEAALLISATSLNIYS